MPEVFRRPRLAAELAGRLLRPGVLDEGLRSGLFLSGLRRTGKTTFLRTDLVPELEARGAVVIYVDLWSDTKASPAALVQAAVRQTLSQLVTPSSPLLSRLRRIKGLDLGGMGFRFGFQLDQLGEAGGVAFANDFLAKGFEAAFTFVNDDANGLAGEGGELVEIAGEEDGAEVGDVPLAGGIGDDETAVGEPGENLGAILGMGLL